MSTIKTLFVLLLLTTLGAAAFIGSGVYNIAADDSHWSMTLSMLETIRKRSIGTRAAAILAPALDDTDLIRSGAGNYSAMCVGCHLHPGARDTELSVGLYPKPPVWSKLGEVDPREAFWVIKHGIKMSGMPAWGKSMDDKYVWGMVAFIRQFPGMTAAQYAAHIAASPGHSHGGGETGAHGDSPRGHHHSPAEDSVSRSSFEPVEDPMAGDAADPAKAPPHEDVGHDHHH